MNFFELTSLLAQLNETMASRKLSRQEKKMWLVKADLFSRILANLVVEDLPRELESYKEIQKLLK